MWAAIRVRRWDPIPFAVAAMFCAQGCSDSADSTANTSTPGTGSASVAPLAHPPQPPVHRSHLYVGELFIQQYHTGEQPVSYRGDQLSRITLHYGEHDTGEIYLASLSVTLKDGTVQEHTPRKAMSVTFNPGVLGRGPQAIEIEQRFEASRR